MAEKPDTLRFFRRRLPHWEVIDGRYFITIRLQGSLPLGTEDEIRNRMLQFREADERSKLTLQRLIFRDMEAAMDRSTTNCHLQDPQIAEMVRRAIVYYHHANLWRVIDFVIMPNHLHLFVTLPGAPISRAMQLFKGWTARQATKLIPQHGENGFWQREWFDHWSRDGMEDERIISYIRNNPVKAGLVKHHNEWPYGSWNTDWTRQS